jgi:sugar O-acyltransferase (sialic acid O-acetyltransferase NeuD family)
MKRLAIIGASGHGKVVADIAKKNGYKEIVFLDDDESRTECGGYPVIGNSSVAGNLQADYFVAIGNPAIRKKIMDRIGNCVTLIHPAAILANNVEIGDGTVVMAGAVINPDVKIGRGCIINTCSSVDHDCVVGDYVHLAVGAHLCGTVHAGNRTWIGAGATVSNNISICEGCTIGAGAVVIRNIEEPGTYIGVPAEMIKEDRNEKV